jgi:hypothetical protein
LTIFVEEEHDDDDSGDPEPTPPTASRACFHDFV